MNHVNSSPRKRNAKIAVKMGLKFRKMPDVVALIFVRQHSKIPYKRTVEISPVYKSDVIKEVLIFVTVKLPMLNGSNKITPKIPEYNVAMSGVVVLLPIYYKQNRFPKYKLLQSSINRRY